MVIEFNANAPALEISKTILCNFMPFFNKVLIDKAENTNPRTKPTKQNVKETGLN